MFDHFVKIGTLSLGNMVMETEATLIRSRSALYRIMLMLVCQFFIWREASQMPVSVFSLTPNIGKCYARDAIIFP